MLLLESERIFCLTKSFYFHFTLNQLQLWRGEEAAAWVLWCVEMGGGNSRNPGAAGAAGVSMTDEKMEPDIQRNQGSIETCSERTNHAQRERNPGKGRDGVHLCRGTWGLRQQQKLRAKRRRKKQCWMQKPLFHLKSLVKYLFKSLAVQEWCNIYESLIHNSFIYEIAFHTLLTLSFFFLRKDSGHHAAKPHIALPSNFPWRFADMYV